MDTVQWPQEIVMKPMEEIVQSTCSKPSLERKIVRPQKEQVLNCPRCNSTNTKFCYYNNYSLSQPRYFCKTCRRYWTQGGSLRSIPVGGGSRKNKRPSSSSSTSSSPSSSISSKNNKLPHDLVVPLPNNSQPSSQNPKIHETKDLNLCFPSTHDLKTISELIQVPNHNIPSTSSMGLMNSFMSMPVSDPNMVYSSGFSFQEFKPTLNFSMDGVGLSGVNGSYGSALQGVGETSSGMLLFPFEDLKQVSSTSGIEENRDQQGNSNGYNLNGILGGGGGGSW